MRRLWIAILLLLVASVAQAGDLPSYTLVIRDHRFQPAELTIPADTKVVLVVRNEDATPEEFESNEFNREKIVLPHSSAKVYVGPLKPGRYAFFGEFHQDTAQGVLVVE